MRSVFAVYRGRSNVLLSDVFTTERKAKQAILDIKKGSSIRGYSLGTAALMASASEGSRGLFVKKLRYNKRMDLQ